MRITVAEQLRGVEFTSKKKVANNTVEFMRPSGSRVVKLHRTEIFEEFPNGRITLNTGGWKTITTKDRLNRALNKHGWFISQRDRIWYLVNHDGEEWVFQDGIAIVPDGNTVTVEGAGKSVKNALKLKKKIEEYSHNFIEKLFAGEVPAPSGGDCWLCLFKDKQTGERWGEWSHNTEHLKAHIKQKYYVPSLLVRAMEVYPEVFSNAAQWELARLWNPADKGKKGFATEAAKQQLGNALRRYLYKQFGFAS